MRNRLCVLLVAAVAAASPEGDSALKEKIQSMLDEAALLEQAGRREEAQRVREEARKLEARGGKDDPRMQALANLEKAIASLDKAGYEGMANELRGMAGRLRTEIKGGGGNVDPDRPDADFWRRNLDTLRIAMKGLLETQRRDAADVMERAIRARELMIEGRGAPKDGPDDAQLSEILFKAGQCWRELKQPEHAERCEELSRHLQHQMEQRRQMEDMVRRKVDEKRSRLGDGAGPDDRIARVEERLDRMERMLQETLKRLEARDRDREAERELQRELDRGR